MPLVKMPLTRWLIATGEAEVRGTTLPPISDPAAVSKHLPPSATPGILAQPVYLHNAIGSSTLFTPRIGKPFQQLPMQG